VFFSSGVIMSGRILIVEDEQDVVKLLKHNLEKEGFRVRYVTDGRVALAEMRRLAEVRDEVQDLVILDLMLPGVDGLEICRQMRRHARYRTTPILMLSGRGEEADRVIGLELGANDYVSKPFGMRELIARVRVLLRREQDQTFEHASLQRGQLYIDPSTHTVKVSDRRVELSALEFRLLHHLASYPGIVFSRDQLLDRVWGNDRMVTPRSVDVYVRRIREKIEPQPGDPAFVQTVHGVGYRFASASD
jgi:DNA-binding response OmpR family regulator